MYKHLFGPVPSRRLGMSLGVDLVPKKVCSLDCVYCEVGKTTKLTTQRMEYIKLANIKQELNDYFAKNPDPDYITFSGYGEPTLNKYIGETMAHIKTLRPHIPVAILTNGTLLFAPDVRQALVQADVVLPSLDSATESGFQKINRPAKGLTVKEIIGGLVAFRKEFSGKMWLEVFILPGYNDSQAELNALKKAIEAINPNSVQLNTLDRPGTVSNLQGATRKELEQIKSHWNLPYVEIIAAAQERTQIQSYRTDTETAILETIARRPCTVDDLAKILGLHINEVNKYLSVLESDKKVKTVELARGTFYQSTHK
jgi:wyosine [tRNA(Phe)-imidazoG37] synthetase (radical SAM superfamily)